MSIRFEAVVSYLGSHRIIRIPSAQDKGLPSRGMLMVTGSINGHSFIAPLEPDGKGGHWFELTGGPLDASNLSAGESVSVIMEPSKEWPEPKIDQDILNAISQAGLLVMWHGLTTNARWAWFRWIRATMNPQTRQKRIATACSKLSKGDKRPCCFNASICTVPEVSKSGILLD